MLQWGHKTQNQSLFQAQLLPN